MPYQQLLSIFVQENGFQIVYLYESPIFQIVQEIYNFFGKGMNAIKQSVKSRQQL